MGRARTLVLVAGCLAQAFWCTASVAESVQAENIERRTGVFLPSHLRHIERGELKRLIRERDEQGKPFHLVDLRNEADHAGGALPGAVNVPLKKLSFVAEKRFGMTEPIVLYGYSTVDRASVNAAVLLANKGYRNVSYYDEGYAGWTASAVSEQTATGADDAKT